MEKLTPREEELMRCFWTRGPLFVRELVALWPEPKPHFNTLSTMVRGLEAKGYVGHKAYGGTYQYYPLVSEEEFSRKTLKGVDNSAGRGFFMLGKTGTQRIDRIHGDAA